MQKPREKASAWGQRRAHLAGEQTPVRQAVKGRGSAPAESGSARPLRSPLPLDQGDGVWRWQEVGGAEVGLDPEGLQALVQGQGMLQALGPAGPADNSGAHTTHSVTENARRREEPVWEATLSSGEDKVRRKPVGTPQVFHRDLLVGILRLPCGWEMLQGTAGWKWPSSPYGALEWELTSDEVHGQAQPRKPPGVAESSRERQQHFLAPRVYQDS